MVLARVVVVGAPRSGKTSLVSQFVCGHFPQGYSPTKKKILYYPCAMVNDRLYEIQLADLPAVATIPENSLEEFEICPGFGLRTATAYVLVYDMTRPDSFKFISTFFSQLQTVKSSVAAVVVGTKQDMTYQVPGEERKEVAAVVRKQWKCVYVECSAKFNWHVSTAFEELVALIDLEFSSDLQQPHRNSKNKPGDVMAKSTGSANSSKHCSIM